MPLQGKGMYIWRLGRIAGGDVQAMAEKAANAGLTHVIIKVADGATPYNEELGRAARDAFRAAGLQVWGWAWVWMREPLHEAAIAAECINALALDGFVIDAEHPAKGRALEAAAYMGALRGLQPHFPVALSSYRYPHVHGSFPWETFLVQCDLNMPQMYWVGESPSECVRYSVAKHRSLPSARPIVPTGAAFGEHYGNSYFRAQPADVVEFLDAVRDSDLPAANFWSWDWTEQHGPDLWDAIAGYDWPVPATPTLDLAEQFWTALTAGDLDALADLYHDNAVYISARRAAQGPAAIRAVFSDLLELLPEAQFEQEELRAEDNVRFLRWSATSAAGSVRSGLDTIGIRAGRIQYHASSYQLAAA